MRETDFIWDANTPSYHKLIPRQKKRPNQTLKKYLEWNILESGGIINIRKDIKAS